MFGRNNGNGGRGEGRSNYGSVNTGFEHDRTNGHSYPSETPMVTFKSTNPAETPGIAINDSSVTQVRPKNQFKFQLLPWFRNFLAVFGFPFN